ncbi:hypothetical protein [Pinibacter aurantiacus]|uniref:Uncharacterized protein n=1 Tax=Pinibacter aurantiacus TaxID=2851599 RepID=A0A9E2W8L8_9BACT|nr:hypothetical protein [Pinibacter aurantiacus]MBV4358367.1 hypothetical protein [Pinibacter aurantiacus]
MARIPIYILLFFGHIAFGQNKYPTKSQLLKSLTQKTKIKNKINESTTWYTIGDDSTYWNADTLLFYNNENYRNGKLICNFIDWNFYKKGAFYVQRIQLCKEPTTATAIKDDDFFTYEVLDGKPLILRIFYKESLVAKFEVSALAKKPLDNRDKETTDVLTLLRVR